MPQEGLYAVGMRWYRRGGLLCPSDDDVGLLRAALADVAGIRETQITPDTGDVDAVFALTGSSAWQVYREVDRALQAGLGQALFARRASEIALRILEV